MILKTLNPRPNISKIIWDDNLKHYAAYAEYRDYNFGRWEYYNWEGYPIANDHNTIKKIYLYYDARPMRISKDADTCNIGYSKKIQGWIVWHFELTFLENEFMEFYPNKILTQTEGALSSAYPESFKIPDMRAAFDIAKIWSRYFQSWH